MIQLQNHCQTQFLHKEELSRQISSLERESVNAQHGAQEQIAEEIERTYLRFTQLEADYITNCNKLEGLMNRRAQFQENLEMPVFGMNNLIHFENLRLIVPIFNYEMDQNVTLTVFWKKVLSVGTQEGWTEEGYKAVLNGLLHGSAFETYHAHKRRRLEFILKQLYDRYHKNVTILDKETTLDNLTRNDGETMQSFCVRLMILIQETAVLDPNNQVQRQDHILRTKIKQNCSQEAYLRLIRLRNEHRSMGATMSIEQIKHTVMETENNANYIHLTKPPNFQAHSMETNMTATTPTLMRNYDRSRSRSRPREDRQYSARPYSLSPRRQEDWNILRHRQRSQTPDRRQRRETTPSQAYEKSNNAEFVTDKSAELRSRLFERGQLTNKPDGQKTFHAPLVENNEPMPEAAPLLQSYKQNPTPQQTPFQHLTQQQFTPQQQNPQFNQQPTPQLQQQQYTPQAQANQQNQQYNHQNQAQQQQQQYIPPATGQQIVQQQFKKNNGYQNQMRPNDKLQQNQKYNFNNRLHNKILQQDVLLVPGYPFYQTVMLNDRCLMCNEGPPHVVSNCPQIRAASKQTQYDNYQGQNNNQQYQQRDNNYRSDPWQRQQNDYRPNPWQRQQNDYRPNPWQRTQNDYRPDPWQRNQNNYRPNQWQKPQNNYRQNNNQTNFRQNNFGQNNRQRNDQPYNQQQYNGYNNNQPRKNNDQQYGRQNNYRPNNNYRSNNNNNQQRPTNYPQVRSEADNTEVKTTQGLNSNSL
jgi:hypothetical protein